MRSVHSLFLISIALFVSGVVFILAGARLVRQAKPAPTSIPAIVPVATVKQIMNGIVQPAASHVFDSVQYISTAAGTEERKPRTDQEWEALGNDAAALIESGNLMLMEGRAVDTRDWTTMSRTMIDAGTIVLQATQRKDADKVFEVGDALNQSCDACHARYRRG